MWLHTVGTVINDGAPKMQAQATPTNWRSDAPLARRSYSTEQAAAALHIRPQTLRAALCLQGHYFGMRPVKLPNGRLLWDVADLDRLTAGEVAA